MKALILCGFFNIIRVLQKVNQKNFSEDVLRALVTGATGFIGSHLVEHLLQKGWTVRCLLRSSSNPRWLKGLPVEIVQGDYFNRKTLQPSLEGSDYVYHAAGLTKAKAKQDYYRANHAVTRNLLEATKEFNPEIRRFVYISSLSCVGPSTNGTPVDESAPLRPITTYGKSKMEAELECHRSMDSLPITIVRPAAVYGPKDTDIYEFFRNVSRGILPTVGFTDRLISLVHVRDVVQTIVLAAENERSTGETYFSSNEEPCSWMEVGKLTAKVMGKKIVRIPVPKALVFAVAALAEFGALFSDKAPLINLEKAKEIVQSGWICSVEKARNELNYRQQVSLEDGIRETVEWYRENGWLS
ncbi:MAG: NAD-dependent epimerase/dehydratase family protein [Bacteroidota bacterium]